MLHCSTIQPEAKLNDTKQDTRSGARVSGSEARDSTVPHLLESTQRQECCSLVDVCPEGPWFVLHATHRKRHAVTQKVAFTCRLVYILLVPRLPSRNELGSMGGWAVPAKHFTWMFYSYSVLRAEYQ